MDMPHILLRTSYLNNKMPSFSIIIPLYNKAPYVSKAVESVIGQTHVDWELTIVDDCSTDGSGDVVAMFTDSRIRLVRLKKNGGVSAARNRGVAESAAPYICFLDADDWWEPTFLEEMAGLIERHPEAGIYGSGYWIVKNGKKRLAPIGIDEGFTEGEINYCRVYAKTLCMPLTSISVCMPKKIFDEMGGFPANIKLGEDFLLWVRVALRHNVVLLNKPLSNYNQDVDTTYRGTHKKQYDIDSFSTFHFDQLAEDESRNKDLKVILDKLRVLSLMSFRRYHLYSHLIKEEIAKVDFKNVEIFYWFYYYSPYWIIAAYCAIKESLFAIKQKIKK